MKTTPPLPTTAPVRSSNRVRRIILVLVAAVILTPVLLIVGTRVSNGNAVKELKERVREKGEPLTFAELEAGLRPISDQENAALALVKVWEKEDPPFWQAFERLEPQLPERTKVVYDPKLPFLGRDAQHFTRSHELSAENIKAANRFVADQSSHLKEIQEALTMPHCRFRIDIRKGYAALLPYVAEMKHETQNFRIALLVALDSGDIELCLFYLEQMLKTGQALSEAPLLIDQLVRVACLKMFLEDTQRLLTHAQLSLPQLEKLQVLVIQADIPRALRGSLVSERVQVLTLFENPDEAADVFSKIGAGDVRTTRTTIGVLGFLGLLSADERLALQTFETALTLVDHNRSIASKDFEDLFDAESLASKGLVPRFFSRIMLPPLKKAGVKFWQYEAQRRAALAGVAVERFRALHDGQLPATLDLLVPALLPKVPADPFVPQPRPLRYRPLKEHGFIVYSLGADRQDTKSVEGSDVSFVVER